MNFRPLAVAGLLLLPAAPARAWDPREHEAIARSALLLSPAFRARVGEEPPKDFLVAVAEGDRFDCSYHRAPRVDPAKEAARLIELLRSGKGRETPVAEARNLGRLVHFLADIALPRTLANAVGKSSPVSFLAHDYVVLRAARPLPGDLVAALRRRGEEAAWGDAVPDSVPAAFRDAVNLVVDAVLLLPPRGADAPDRGPALFSLVNTVHPPPVASGLNDPTYDRWSWEMAQFEKPMAGYTLDRGFRFLLSARRLDVVEMTPRTEGGRTRVRALLVNRQGFCYRNLVLGTSQWRADVPGILPALSARIVEFEGRPETPEDVLLQGTRGGCAGAAPGDAVSLDWSVVSALGARNVLDFRERREFRVPRPEPPAGAWDVEYDSEAVRRAMGDVHLWVLQARAVEGGWELDVEAMRRSGRAPGTGFVLQLEAVEGTRSASYTVKMEPMQGGSFQSWALPVKERPGRFRAPTFRLASIRPDLR